MIQRVELGCSSKFRSIKVQRLLSSLIIYSLKGATLLFKIKMLFVISEIMLIWKNLNLAENQEFLKYNTNTKFHFLLAKKKMYKSSEF